MRQHRERLGLSPGRVAELIGRSASTVRAWEKGRQTPTDPVAISLLAAVLDVDERRLLDAAGVEAPTREQTMTIEQALSTIAPEAAPHPEEGEPSDGDVPGEVDRTPAEEVDAVPVVEEPTRAPTSRAGARAQARSAGRRPEPALHQPDPAVQTPSRSSGYDPTASYMDDPEQRMVYRLRALYTLIGLAVVFVVLAWAAANAFDAFGEVWDQLTSWI